MSGGYFDYQQYRMRDMADKIKEYVDGYPIEDENLDWYIKNNYLPDDEEKYIRENKHTMPNKWKFSKETVEKFKEAIKYLRMAEIYANRVDYLLEGDDDEEDFHERLEEDINNYKNEKENE